MLTYNKEYKMTKPQYNRAQTKIATANTGINTSKAYKQVAMRQLCKYMKVPADTWRGVANRDLELLQSLASNIVAYGRLSPKQWGLAKMKLVTHRR